jgi:type VI secretion system secreted protein Hcp
MATRLFLQLDGVEGNAMDSGAVDHMGWIDISSVSCGINNSINVVDKVKGGTSGEASSLSDISITKQLDKTSTQLYAYCAVGKVWTEPAMIDVMEEENLLFQIKLHTPALQQISVAGSEGGEPFESISFGFSKIEWKFREDPEQAWNLCTNSGTLEKGAVPAAPA